MFQSLEKICVTILFFFVILPLFGILGFAFIKGLTQ